MVVFIIAKIKAVARDMYQIKSLLQHTNESTPAPSFSNLFPKMDARDGEDTPEMMLFVSRVVIENLHWNTRN